MCEDGWLNLSVLPYLLYREYGLQETILIVVGLFFCVWLFERV